MFKKIAEQCIYQNGPFYSTFSILIEPLTIHNVLNIIYIYIYIYIIYKYIYIYDIYIYIYLYIYIAIIYEGTLQCMQFSYLCCNIVHIFKLVIFLFLKLILTYILQKILLRLIYIYIYIYIYSYKVINQSRLQIRIPHHVLT